VSDPTEFDAVVVATPGSTHAAVALPFIAAGVPTYIEKPLTTSRKDAQAIERAAKKAARLRQGSGGRAGIIFVGHIHRYNPAYLVAKHQVRLAGTIRYLYFEGTNNGPFREDMAAFWDWAPHDVYLAMDLMEGAPKHVQAWGIKALRPDTELYDFCVIKMTWPDGREAISTTSWLLPVKQKKVTIVGEKDMVVFDDAAEKKVIVYAGAGPRVKGGSVEKQDPTLSYPAYDTKPSLQAELEAFIDCIQKKEQPLTGLTDGVAVVRVLAAAERSLKLDGRKVRL
jgi:predicted dehydrogenase